MSCNVIKSNYHLHDNNMDYVLCENFQHNIFCSMAQVCELGATQTQNFLSNYSDGKALIIEYQKTNSFKWLL